MLPGKPELLPGQSGDLLPPYGVPKDNLSLIFFFGPADKYKNDEVDMTSSGSLKRILLLGEKQFINKGGFH